MCKFSYVLLCFSLFALTSCSSGNASTLPATSPPPSKDAYTVTGADGKSYTIPAGPDPSMNKATVAGIDSNNDGIRDDVERWIASTWKPGSQEYFAVRQLARTEQKFITTIENINHITKHSYMDETAKSNSCLWVVYPGFSGINRIADNLFIAINEQTYNTNARWKAYREGSSKMGGAISDGKYFGRPASEVCEGR